MDYTDDTDLTLKVILRLFLICEISVHLGRAYGFSPGLFTTTAGMF